MTDDILTLALGDLKPCPRCGTGKVMRVAKGVCRPCNEQGIEEVQEGAYDEEC